MSVDSEVGSGTSKTTNLPDQRWQAQKGEFIVVPVCIIMVAHKIMIMYSVTTEGDSGTASRSTTNVSPLATHQQSKRDHITFSFRVS